LFEKRKMGTSWSAQLRKEDLQLLLRNGLGVVECENLLVDIFV